MFDRVESYFALRSVAIGPDVNGVPRMLLNGRPVFQFGPLDQGWWPDGLYTAPTDSALRFDLEITKKLGFNLVRKHVKVEPERWYYHCDRIGLLVWQDMPSGDANAPWPVDSTELKRSNESAEIYDRELKALIESRRNCPCIIAWVPFNEAWGQFDTVRVTRLVRELDPHRLVISASGGNDFGVGDIRDIHFYPQPESTPAERNRAVVLGEYGGLGLPLSGHTWQDQKNWGYRRFQSREELADVYLKYIEALRPMIESRLSAVVYTQTTDVEIETNGLMTYDRDVLKFDAAKLAEAHAKLYEPLRKLSDAEKSAAYTLAYWRFEEGKPGDLVLHDRQKRDGRAAIDTSGNRNHLYAYSDRNAPRNSSDVPAAVVPRLGLANSGSLDDSASGDGATRDLYTDHGRSGTHMNALATYPLTEWTIELSVKPKVVGKKQSLIGKDGKPAGGPEAPLQVQLREDGRLAVSFVDAGGAARSVATRNPLPLDQWQHLAARCDGKRVELLRVVSGKYESEGTTACDGGLTLSVGTWTIGRGFHDGRIGLDGQAVLDEIR
ncbi:MAG TPA: glycoside hydrolase family 2 TIM barrel-domain containing protein, partial [Pirellulaceae bacterium]|nr:glycoside hydrolase family 2 TIM barrel-domain containing protein [Pirellulaceae bacterium]